MIDPIVSINQSKKDSFLCEPNGVKWTFDRLLSNGWIVSICTILLLLCFICSFIYIEVLFTALQAQIFSCAFPLLGVGINKYKAYRQTFSECLQIFQHLNIYKPSRDYWFNMNYTEVVSLCHILYPLTFSTRPSVIHELQQSDRQTDG